MTNHILFSLGLVLLSVALGITQPCRSAEPLQIETPKSDDRASGDATSNEAQTTNKIPKPGPLKGTIEKKETNIAPEENAVPQDNLRQPLPDGRKRAALPARILIAFYDIKLSGWDQATTEIEVTSYGSVKVGREGARAFVGSGHITFVQYVIDDKTHCQYSYAGLRGNPAIGDPFGQDNVDLADPDIAKLAEDLRAAYPQAETIVIESNNIQLGGCKNVNFEMLTPRYSKLETGSIVAVNHCAIDIGSSRHCIFRQKSSYTPACVAHDFSYNVGGSSDCQYSFDYSQGVLTSSGLKIQEGKENLPESFAVIQKHFESLDRKYR